ncbi:MAG: Lrp/AsnC family transcriptional regulator [Thiohalophilus sp.]|jgi:DNA-binding Lrp family transcriptional regulator
MPLDTTDKDIINQMQQGFPICENPYAEVATSLGLNEDELIGRLQAMLDDRTLTRFGPMYQAERLGGAFSLVAMAVPEQDFERVADIVNDFPEVAHNYEREHRFNMWFVLATETPQRVPEVLAEIESRSGYRCYNMPKEKEFFVNLQLSV